MKVGLRVDLDTYNGTRDGLGAILEDLAHIRDRGSFFFCLGPDNMGRHLWRLLKPKFFLKMITSNAAGLYGLDILLRGTFWPGPDIYPVIPARLLRQAQNQGNEIGLHAWDHRFWQARAQKMTEDQIQALLKKSLALLSELAGTKIDCFAAPSWKGTPALLKAEKQLGLRYASDCRGSEVFSPHLPDSSPGVPQVPVNLPTYDEVIGRNGLNDKNYNRFILEKIEQQVYQVLTIHAEVEGVAKRALFQDFLEQAQARGIQFVPLGELIPADLSTLPRHEIQRGEVTGREGWVAIKKAEGV